MNTWGKHLVYDGFDCNQVTIRSQHIIATFLKELVVAIDMVAYGEPIIKHFGEGNKAGFTAIQLIETSNICVHFIEETNDLCLDLFSCKDFDTKIAIDLIHKYFSPKTEKYATHNRGRTYATPAEESATQGPQEDWIGETTGCSNSQSEEESRKGVIDVDGNYHWKMVKYYDRNPCVLIDNDQKTYRKFADEKNVQ